MDKLKEILGTTSNALVGVAVSLGALLLIGIIWGIAVYTKNINWTEKATAVGTTYTALGPAVKSAAANSLPSINSPNLSFNIMGDSNTASTFFTKFISSPDFSYQVSRILVGLTIAAVVIGLFFGLGIESSYSKSITYIVYAVLGLGGVYILTKFAESGLDKPGLAVPSVLFRLLYYFLPYGILMYTSLSDIFNANFKYSGATITGVIAVILNSLISKMFFSSTDANGNKIPIVDSNKCGIPGFSFLGSNLLPQGMLFNLTSLSTLAVLITQETERDSKYTVPIWSFLVSIFIASIYMLVSGDCFKNVKQPFFFENKFPGYGAFITVVVTFAVALVAGTAGGFGIWGGLKEGFAGYVDPKKEKELKKKTGTDEVVNVSTSLAEVCPAVSGDQIVAEIYQNGEKISTTATET